MLREKGVKKEYNWRRINMRNVEHLLGVEFMHDLYNRHQTRINFIRFRNTITTWRYGVVNSYAPEKEWDLLEKWFGEEFYSLDNTTIEEFKILLNSNRDFFNEQIKQFESSKLAELSNSELGLFLIKVQQHSLGELYRMNFVQAEYSLTFAIKRILKEVSDDETKIDSIFAKLIVAKELTESQKEELAFNKILKRKKVLDEEITEKTDILIKNHWDAFAYMHSAYGEDPYSLNYYVERIKNFDPLTSKIDLLLEKKISKAHKESKKLLATINNNKLNVLIPLMIKGGTFRDKNKASLGYTIKYKHIILNEIANRDLEKRINLNFYLMSEILNLLNTKTKINSKTIELRQTNGVVLYRKEYMDPYDQTELEKEGLSFNVPIRKHDTKTLKGTCASPGLAEGIVKIIKTGRDGRKVTKGDIMVAIGTDFDLMDAIHRSSAVITEEGGLLSHASVVCREMKKPCNIGVRDATSLLKDGDYIKLDATKGTIEIIEKSVNKKR